MEKKRKFSGSNSLVALVLFLAFFSAYFVLSPKMIHGSNGGSSFSILRAIDSGTFPELDERAAAYTGHVNFSTLEGRYFSDRPPGLALLSLPFHLASRGLSEGLGLAYYPRSFEEEHDGKEGNVLDYFPLSSLAISLDHLVPIALSAGAVALLFLIFRLFTRSKGAPAALAVLFGVGTMFLKYATVFFAHNASVFFVLLAAYLAFGKNATARRWPWWKFTLFSLAASFSILLEYQLALFVAALAAYLLFSYRSFFQIRKGQWLNWNVLAGILPAAVPPALLGAYQYAMFGSPLATTFSQHGFYLYTRTFGGTFSGNISKGLYGLLLDPAHNGLFFASPFMLLGLLAALFALRKRPKEILFLLGAAVAHILIIAKFKEWHGGTVYPRYIGWSSAALYAAGAIGLLHLVALYKEAKRARRAAIAAFMALFALLGLYGIYQNLADMGTFFAGIKIIGPICPTLNLLACGPAAYASGLSHWPLLAAVLGFLGGVGALFAFARKGRWVFAAASVLVAAIIIGLSLFFMTGVADWKERSVVLEENFHIWYAEQAPQKEVGSDGQAIDRVSSWANVQGRGGDIVYPDSSSEPAVLEYALPGRNAPERMYLVADFTIVGQGNFVRAEYAGPRGSTHPIFSVRGSEAEQRYILKKELLNINAQEEGNVLRIELFAHEDSTTLADARLEFFQVYATKGGL